MSSITGYSPSIRDFNYASSRKIHRQSLSEGFALTRTEKERIAGNSRAIRPPY